MNEINLSRVDLNLLVLFETVFEERSVRRASERLSLTSSAVSHGLGRLRRLFADPLFLRTPKGVVPTARALDLAEPIHDALRRVRAIISVASPFEPLHSSRCFTIGAPDAIAATFLPALLRDLAMHAPQIDLRLRHLLPPPRKRVPQQAWEQVLAELDAGTLDVAVVPLGSVPARFASRALYDEDFVVAARRDHPFLADPTLDRYCTSLHVVVSLTGDAHGLFEEALTRVGRKRRVCVTVPNFVQAMALVSETELLVALPRRLAALYAEPFRLGTAEVPIRRDSDPISAVATRAAMADGGIAWLMDRLQHVSRGSGDWKNRARRARSRN